MPIHASLLDAIVSGTGYFTTLVKVTQDPSKGTEELRFCLHTRPIDFDGDTYEAMSFNPSKVQLQSGVQPINASLAHMLDGEFTLRNVRGGKWQGATLVMMLIDYLHPEWGYLRRHIGRVGEVKTAGKMAETEFKGIISLLNQEIGDKTSKSCRYTLGDAECARTRPGLDPLDVADFTFPGEITVVTDNQSFETTIGGGFREGLTIRTFAGLNFDRELIRRRSRSGVNINYTNLFITDRFGTSRSARFEGQVIADYTESYTFTIEHSGGAKVWIGGVLVIDQWATPGTHASAAIPFVANTPQAIKVEANSLASPFVVRLQWESATVTPAEYIPITNFDGRTIVYQTNYFQYGKIVWTSGLNDGLEMEVMSSDEFGNLVLFLPMFEDVVVGDTFNLIAGDDKSLHTCHHKFNNAINHGGEDCIPKQEVLFKIPVLA